MSEFSRLAKINSGLEVLVKEITGLAEKETVEKARSYAVSDEQHGDNVSLYTWAERRGLEQEIPKLVNTYRRTAKGRLGRLHNIGMALVDVGEDVFEGVDTISQVARKGTIALELPWRSIEIPTYVAKRIFTAGVVDGMLGFGSGNYTWDRAGLRNYLADQGVGVAADVANQVDLLGSAFEWLTHADDRTPRLQDAALRYTFNRLREMDPLQQTLQQPSVDEVARTYPRAAQRQAGVVDYNTFLNRRDGDRYPTDFVSAARTGYEARAA